MANFFSASCHISPLSSIEISSRGSNTYVDEDSVIDDFVKIKHVGGQGDVKIGKKVMINSCTVIYSGNGVDIQDNVLIGPNCSIMPVNHRFQQKDTPINRQGFMESKGGIVVEEDVWIGANVILLDGALIRKGAVIGAGALVNKEVEAYSVNVGNPLKCVGKRS